MADCVRWNAAAGQSLRLSHFSAFTGEGVTVKWAAVAEQDQNPIVLYGLFERHLSVERVDNRVEQHSPARSILRAFQSSVWLQFLHTQLLRLARSMWCSLLGGGSDSRRTLHRGGAQMHVLLRITRLFFNIFALGRLPSLFKCPRPLAQNVQILEAMTTLTTAN